MKAKSLFVALATALILCRMPPAHAGVRIGSVDFSPCTLTGSQPVAAIAAQCAQLAVPEVPSKPSGRKIELHLAMVASHSPRAESDWVTLLAGGPGQGAIESFPETEAAFEPLHRHHNILLIDQRGTGESHPLRCPDRDWNAPDSDQPQVLRAYAEDCRKRLEGDADLSQYTPGNAVEDLETVRRAL